MSQSFQVSPSFYKTFWIIFAIILLLATAGGMYFCFWGPRHEPAVTTVTVPTTAPTTQPLASASAGEQALLKVAEALTTTNAQLGTTNAKLDTIVDVNTKTNTKLGDVVKKLDEVSASSLAMIEGQKVSAKDLKELEEKLTCKFKDPEPTAATSPGATGTITPPLADQPFVKLIIVDHDGNLLNCFPKARLKKAYDNCKDSLKEYLPDGETQWQFTTMPIATGPAFADTDPNPRQMVSVSGPGIKERWMNVPYRDIVTVSLNGKSFVYLPLDGKVKKLEGEMFLADQSKTYRIQENTDGQ